MSFKTIAGGFNGAVDNENFFLQIYQNKLVALNSSFTHS